MQNKLLSLDISIITHREDGIERVATMLNEPTDGIRYVVSWQAHGDAPIPKSLAARADVDIHRLDRAGLSHNRNNAISHCHGDIILNCDDDIVIYPEGLEELRRIFTATPELDVGTFRSIHGDPAHYPSTEKNLNEGMPKGYYVCSIEIAMRRETAGHLRCCPELGLGSRRMYGGEDEMLLQSAIHRGLTCRYYPVTICAHPHESTGSRGGLTNSNLRAAGCVIALSYPRTAVLRAPLKAWRIWKEGRASLVKSLLYVCMGAAEAPGVLRRNRDTLW